METRLKRHHKLMIATFVALTAALMAAVAVYAYDQSQEDRIAPGVTVGGVDIGGRSADDAREVIEREVVDPLQKPVEVEYEGETYRLSSKELDQTADVDGMVDEAVEVSREGNIFDRVVRYVQGSDRDLDIDPQVSYSRGRGRRLRRRCRRRGQPGPRRREHRALHRRADSDPGRARRRASGEQARGANHRPGRVPGRREGDRGPGRKVAPEVTTKELSEAYPTYITVDQSTYTLRLFVNLKLAKEYGVAVGGGGYYTPTGLHSIQDKQVDPTWNVPTSSWAGDLAGQSIPPGPSNPLKARWMGIYNGAGIHGTDDTGSIGSAASHGCVRMTVDDVIDLFDRVEVGTPIYIQ